ncbi:MAG TPA: hypothetical protein VLK65_22460 [Vicinamibacteria bacterium]|nr:hypothetical protein [Vicinamibacteria bacterium]
MRRQAVTACLLILAYAAFTIVFTYPLAWHLGTHHVGEAGGDAKSYLWSYWWVSRALRAGVNPFETDAIFHPIGIGLSLHTLALSQGVAFTALSTLVGEVRAANLVVLWTFVASALAAYALAREVGSGPAGAFLAGTIFAFCPYRLARLSGHYDLLGTEWLPLYALFLWKSRERPVLALVAGVVAALAGYTAATYLVFIALFAALLSCFRRDLLWRAAASGAVAAILLSPLLLQLRRDLGDWTYPPYAGGDVYAANPASYVTRSTDAANVTEATVFAGYSVLALALGGLWHRRSHRALPFWLASAGVFLLLSLGGVPFEILSGLPLLEHLRAPSRFSIMVMLSLAIVAALVWSLMKTTLGKGYLYVTALAGATVIAEFLTVPVPLFAAELHPVYARIAAEKSMGTVIEIPGIEQSPGEIMFHQTVHEKPILVGSVARVPREKTEYYLGLPLVRPLIDLRKGKLELTEELVAQERETAPAVARFLGLGYFLLDEAYRKRGVVSFVERVLPVDTWYEDDTLVVLKTRSDALPPNPEAVSAASRAHFESGWSRPEREQDFVFRWTNRERSTILFRRPAGSRVAVIEVAPLEGTEQELTVRSDRFLLSSGWQDVRLELGPGTNGEVERLELGWSRLTRASERDPRRLAARVRAIRFE